MCIDMKWTIPGACLLVLLFCSSARAGTDYFDTLGEKLSPEEKFLAVKSIYRSRIRSLDSSSAMEALDLLKKKAVKRGDVMLEIMAEGLMGNYLEDCCKQDQKRILRHYKHGFRLSQDHHIRVTEVWMAHQLGRFYYANASYPLAFEYLLRAHTMLQSTDYRHFPEAMRYLYELGLAYFEFGYYKKSITYLQDAAGCPTPEDLWYAVSVNNTLALAYQHLTMIDSAEHYFNEALSYAVRKKDTAWIGIISGNLGHIHFTNKEYDKAMPLLHYDLEISTKYKVWASVVSCLLSMSEYALVQGDLHAAERYLDSVRMYMDLSDNKFVHTVYLYRNLSDLYNHKGDMRRAYVYLDSFMVFRDSLTKQKDSRMLAQIEAKIETEKHLAKLQLIESERGKQIIVRNAVMIALVLLIIIVLQLLHRIRLKQRKDRKIYLLEKKRAEDEIRNARQLLGSYVESVREKSQLIVNFKDEIRKLRQISDQAHHEQDQIIEKLHEASILTEKDWIEFKRLFNKVHKGFFEHLDVKYPDLTQAEIRLLALTKLKLTVNEMANMLGISSDSVRKTRLRLKKKLNLPDHTGLEDIID